MKSEIYLSSFIPDGNFIKTLFTKIKKQKLSKPKKTYNQTRIYAGSDKPKNCSKCSCEMEVGDRQHLCKVCRKEYTKKIREKQKAEKFFKEATKGAIFKSTLFAEE